MANIDAPMVMLKMKMYPKGLCVLMLKVYVRIRARPHCTGHLCYVVPGLSKTKTVSKWELSTDVGATAYI